MPENCEGWALVEVNVDGKIEELSLRITTSMREFAERTGISIETQTEERVAARYGVDPFRDVMLTIHHDWTRKGTAYKWRKDRGVLRWDDNRGWVTDESGGWGV